MTVGELMELLESFSPDAEIRLASQPSWPMEYSLATVGSIDADDEDEDGEDGEVVYLAEGTQIGYLPGAVASQLGWGR